eukprot:4190018-Alexandrium_andersonii.AAC.1
MKYGDRWRRMSKRPRRCSTKSVVSSIWIRRAYAYRLWGMLPRPWPVRCLSMHQWEMRVLRALQRMSASTAKHAHVPQLSRKRNCLRNSSRS